MTSPIVRPSAQVELDAGTFGVISGDIGMDSSDVPYASASIDIALTSDELVEAIDPRDDQRAIVTCGDESAGTSRVFDLGVRGRRVSTDRKTITLTLASDEARLQEYATLTTDTGARAHESSLRAVVNYVLGKIGASLEPGTDDADVTAQWSLMNELPNPSGEVDETGWTAAVNCTMFSQVGAAFSGGKAIGVLSSAAGSLAFYAMPPTSRQSVRPGQMKTFRVAFKSNYASGRTARLSLRWFDSQGNWYTADTHGATHTPTSTAWTDGLYVTGTAPKGADSVLPYVTITGSTAGAQGYYVDKAGLFDGDFTDYFSGNTPDTANYEYEWTKDDDLSMSLRTPTVERLPEMFTWKPGVTAWEFLMPITSAAGMVLWCDEQRRWFLALPESRTLTDLVSVSGANATRGDDTLSRDDDGAYVTGVVVQYTWRDDDDIDREAFDTAGTSEKVLRIEFRRPYPGPGAAAAILARRQGTGRRQEVTALVRWDTTPGMTAQFSLPGSPDTVGRITSVRFDIAAGLMDIGSAGLVDIIPGSIAALAGTIDDLVGDIDSL